MYSYIAYGLGIRSVLLLPELLASAEAGTDATIRFGEVTFPEGIKDPEHDFHMTDDEAYIYWKTLGKFLIRQGREIIIDPAEEATPEAIRLPLLGTVLALLIHQRGYLVLHGSCVALSGEAVAILGNKGWGKSTLAATLYGRGHQLIADDLVVLDLDNSEMPFVVPGYPQFKLWPDAAETLGDAPDDLPRLHPLYEKRSRRVTERFGRRPLPLKRIYVLATGESLEIEPMPPQEAWIQLVCHTYGSRFGNDLIRGSAAREHFKQASQLLKRVPVCWLKRYSDLEAVPILASMIEADVHPSRVVDRELHLVQEPVLV